jgi:repressor LexA
MTERQEKVLEFVRSFSRAEGVPPSTREVAARFKVDQSTAKQHLQALGRDGHLQKLTDGRWGFPAGELAARWRFPVLGSIPAGIADQREQEVEEFIEINPVTFGVKNPRPDHFWFLRVAGQSMEGAGILNGDLVALHRREPQPGDIIAALVNETDTTLKRYVVEKGRPILRAANPRFSDQYPERLQCQGVKVGVLRRDSA